MYKSEFFYQEKPLIKKRGNFFQKSSRKIPMKKHLACPISTNEIRLEISEIPETRPINPIFVEPDNLAHPLQLAKEILELINPYVKTKTE